MNKFLFISFMLLTTTIFSDNQLCDIDHSPLWSKIEDGNVKYYTRIDSGKVPILCFHEIGPEPRYQITAENFENFLIYLNNNDFYPLSDKEFLQRDFSRVPTGFTPIVLGSDDASKGNFLYKTLDDGTLSRKFEEESMVYLLEKYIAPADEKINFTFYVSFNGIPFRQSGDDVIGDKFNYLLDNFIVGIHTVTHPVTKNTSPVDFKWELDEFYNIMHSYVGDRISMIDTLAYPYGCADLKPEMRQMIESYNEREMNILGAFDFNGYFSHSPFSARVDFYDVSRLGVDNQNISNVYVFLESVPLFKTERIIVVNSLEDLKGIKRNNSDVIIVGGE